MKAASGIAAAALVVLGIAACGPSAGIPAAAAMPAEAAPVLYPALAEGAADGQVFEYH